MTLITGELEYKDIHDFNTNHTGGFSAGTNIGGSTNQQTGTFHPSGTTTIGMKDLGSDKEQTTKATIGQGTIVVGGNSDANLAGLNRDTDNMQEITKDMITGALNGTLTVDNDMLINRPLDILTNPWNAPNTTIGLGNALANIGYGAIAGPYTWTDDKGVLQERKLNASINDDSVLELSGGRLNIGGGIGLSLGKVNTFYGKYGPESEVISSYTNSPIVLGKHEGKHNYQSNWLGIFYIPTYLISGGASGDNWMERQADRSGQIYGASLPR